MRKFVQETFSCTTPPHTNRRCKVFYLLRCKNVCAKIRLARQLLLQLPCKNHCNATNCPPKTNLAGSFRNDGAQNVCKRQNAPVFNSIIIYSQTSFVNSSYPSPDTAKRMLTCENCFKMCLTNELLRHLQNAGKFQTSGKHRLMLPPLSTATKRLSVSKQRQASTAGKVLTFPTTTIFISTKKGRNVSIPPRFSNVTLPCNLRCFQ